LSVSSPHLLAYILHKKNTLTAVNLDKREKNNFSKKSNIHFKIEDATCLSFPNESFDIVYSISVIEHIFKKYTEAVNEMIRVTKHNGYIYITCPVAPFQKEEWLTTDYYQNTIKKSEKIFFQYRFSKNTIDLILAEVENCEIIAKEIFWEKRKDGFNILIQKIIKSHSRSKFLKIFIQAYLNIYYGFNLLANSPSLNFSQNKTFGNIHIILKKK
jgi:ubiquinone/menaquinone biosynthesis C-methylase UbiE